LISTLLKSSGYAAESTETIRAVEPTESSLLLGLIVTDEALANDGVEALRKLIDAQPDWSDLPVILLTSGPREPRHAVTASQVRVEFRSVFLLDRPVRKELLLSAVQVAYNSRMKQLEVRDAAARQFQSDETLRNAEKLATAGRLAATMAHEVNNPLEALSNLLFLIERSSSVEDAKSFGRMAAQELQRISEIVSQTLRFHRAPAKPAFTDVAELATSALALFRGKLRERNISEFIAAEPTLAFCSAGEIRQAVVNLIGNALDAMADGGRLHLRVSSVSRNGAPCARLTIADTGSGIRAEIRSSLFNQFFTTKGSRGTGLGLWLTRDIVLRNCGRLRFRSRTSTPSGTVFTIYLPSVPPATLAPADASSRRNEPATIEAA
jgi:signal transduction histidine kinase